MRVLDPAAHGSRQCSRELNTVQLARKAPQASAILSSRHPGRSVHAEGRNIACADGADLAGGSTARGFGSGVATGATGASVFGTGAVMQAALNAASIHTTACAASEWIS